MDKYIELAKKLGMENAKLITSKDICFDIRAILKCRWGCEDFFQQNIKCHSRDTTYQERMEMIKNYTSILLVHAHDEIKLSAAVLELERAAFLDGYYFAFAVRTCHLCDSCAVDQKKPCPTPE